MITRTLAALLAVMSLIFGYGCGNFKKPSPQHIQPHEEKHVEQPVTGQPTNKIESTSTTEQQCDADPTKNWENGECKDKVVNSLTDEVKCIDDHTKFWDENQCKDISTLLTERNCVEAGQRWDHGTCNSIATEPVNNNSINITIVSPATCQNVNDLLTNCQVSTQTFNAQSTQIPTTIPLAATWIREISGDCQGSYAIQVNLVSAAGDKYPINLSTDKGGILPVSADSPITSFQIVGSGYWQGRAYFKNSCRITLKVNID